MANIKNFFRRVFGLKVREETYLTQPPKDTLKQLQKEYYTKKLMQENAQKDTELKKLRQKIQRIKEQKEDEKQIKEINKQILKKRELDTKLEKSNSFMLYVKGPKRFPILYTKQDNPIGRWVGFWIKPTDDGRTIYYPVIKLKNNIKRINCPIVDPRKLFRSSINISKQVKSGKIDTNLDFNKDGKPIIIEEKDIYQKLAEKEYGGNVKVIRMDDAERKDYEKQIASLRDERKQLFGIIKELKEKEIDYEDNLNELMANNSYLSKDRDTQVAHASNLQDKQIQMVQETAKANAGLQDATLNQMMTERAFNKAWDVYDKVVNKMAKYVPEDTKGIALREASDVLKQGIEIAQSAYESNNKLQKDKQEGENKKGEKKDD
ncbi:MAG: hypothetical protein ACP5D2_02750 [Candidatus Nanoarchaeia archaeon]